MKSISLNLVMALVAILFFSACNSSAIQDTKQADQVLMNVSVADTVAVASPVSAEMPLEKEEEQAPQVQSPKEVEQQQPSNQWEKKIIKTGNLRVRVDHLGEYEKGVKEKIKGLGGYVATEEQHSNDANVQKTLVIKVPVGSFDKLVGDISQQGAELLEKSVSAQDVSEEFYDLTTRLASKKKILQQYLDILSKAKKVSEILEVQAEIDRIQEELESVEGRARYLSQQSALSTLTLNIETHEKAITLEPSFGSRLLKELKEGWEFLKNLLLGVVGFWPIWTVALLGIFLWRRFKRRS